MEARPVTLAADELAGLLRTVLSHSKLETGRTLSGEVADLALAVRLSIKLDRPTREPVGTTAAMRQGAPQVHLIAGGSRVD